MGCFPASWEDNAAKTTNKTEERELLVPAVGSGLSVSWVLKPEPSWRELAFYSYTSE